MTFYSNYAMARTLNSLGRTTNILHQENIGSLSSNPSVSELSIRNEVEPITCSSVLLCALGLNDKPPHEFICPMSYDIMREPTVASDGFSYEGEYILQWLNTNNNPRSPMTREVLNNSDTYPNINLRILINNWLENHINNENDIINYYNSLKRVLPKEILYIDKCIDEISRLDMGCSLDDYNKVKIIYPSFLDDFEKINFYNGGYIDNNTKGLIERNIIRYKIFKLLSKNKIDSKTLLKLVRKKEILYNNYIKENKEDIERIKERNEHLNEIINNSHFSFSDVFSYTRKYGNVRLIQRNTDTELYAFDINSSEGQEIKNLIENNNSIQEKWSNEIGYILLDIKKLRKGETNTNVFQDLKPQTRKFIEERIDSVQKKVNKHDYDIVWPPEKRGLVNSINVYYDDEGGLQFGGSRYKIRKTKRMNKYKKIKKTKKTKKRY